MHSEDGDETATQASAMSPVPGLGPSCDVTPDLDQALEELEEDPANSWLVAPDAYGAEDFFAALPLHFREALIKAGISPDEPETFIGVFAHLQYHELVDLLESEQVQPEDIREVTDLIASLLACLAPAATTHARTLASRRHYFEVPQALQNLQTSRAL